MTSAAIRRAAWLGSLGCLLSATAHAQPAPPAAGDEPVVPAPAASAPLPAAAPPVAATPPPATPAPATPAPATPAPAPIVLKATVDGPPAGDVPSPEAARSGVTGWAHIGGGMLFWEGSSEEEGARSQTSGLLSIDMGMGYDDLGPFSVGGLFKIQPIFTDGIDLALMARITTSGFNHGWFGVAVDVGGYQRFWTPESTGGMAQVTLGGPFGLQATAQGMYGTNETRAVGFSVGLDFMRLTVGREYLTDYWPNPNPGQRSASR